ncbi:hypothetical protein LQ946_06450 [Yersinia enterocolitica]|nr:hypothetical protein [Yersinia enterocolitica]MCY1686504.1 hypothetical protein [Yersinia enterocolitica]
MCIQHLSEVRTDIVFIETEVNDIVLLQFLHLKTRLLFGRQVAAVFCTSASAHARLVIICAFVGTTSRYSQNWQSQH